jgi:Na+/H+ antiporter NhaD/arsenite permease-like protein
MRVIVGALCGVLVAAGPAAAAEQHEPLSLEWWTVVPFAALLLLIALLPVVAERFWHHNRNRALVVFLLSAPMAGYLVWFEQQTGEPAVHALLDKVFEYVQFIVLLAALYTISGSIVLTGNLVGKPLTNTGFLALGSVLANLIGTTGASMLLIRPMLRINQERQNNHHVPIFFIFTVSNVGGLLTPLGDPPLFLGYLHGVDFFWTLQLWPHWLVVNGIVLTIFFVWDAIAHAREPARALAADVRAYQPLRLSGSFNFVLLLGVVLAVLFQKDISHVAAVHLGVARFGSEAVMVAMALLSLLLTPRAQRQANGYSWGPILEVAILFAGIFVTMVPALELLRKHGAAFGLDQHWQYFWLTGSLSSFLDNAPTYLTFATLAAGSEDFTILMNDPRQLLQGISCGAVFMGAMTYIGNGPNFMVKAIADQNGCRTPSFFGYMLYSGLILLPTFVLVTFLFFPI